MPDRARTLVARPRSGASHNSAGRAPCQRTANDSDPVQRDGIDGDRLAQPIGREAREELDGAGPLAYEHRSHAGQESRGLPAGIDRVVAVHGSSSADRFRARAVPVQPSGAQPSRGLGIESPVFERDDRRVVAVARSRSARAASTARADRRRELGLHAPLELAFPAARDRVGVGQRARRRRGELASTARSVVRCGTGNSNASSTGPRARSTGPVRAAPRDDLPADAAAAHAPGGRGNTSTIAPSTRNTVPSSSTTPRR